MTCKSLTECQIKLNSFLVENNNLCIFYTNLYNDILYRKNVLESWSTAPPELQEAAHRAYNDSVNKFDTINESYKQVLNLKEVLSYTNNTLISVLMDVDNTQLNLLNINNLIDNYSTLKNTFLGKYGHLLGA